MAKSTSISVPKPRQLASGSWFIQLRLDGISTPVTAATENECINTAMQIKAAHRAGQRATKPKGGDKTLRQAIDDYINARSNTLSPATIRGYQNIRDERFKAVMDKPIKSIKDWQKVCNEEAKLCSAKTLKNAWRFALSVIAKETGNRPQVQLPQVVQKDIVYLQPKQIQIFVKALVGTDCEISALLALHSLRRSEILALDWINVDLENKRILVSGATVWGADGKLTDKATTKNEASRRYVPIMIPELETALNAAHNKKGKVVNIAPNTMRKQINRVCEVNALPLVSVHGLRHSFASLAYHLGMSEKQCMKLGGWSDDRTMKKIYTHLADADVKDSENKMAEFYKTLTKNANEEKKSSIINAYTV